MCPIFAARRDAVLALVLLPLALGCNDVATAPPRPAEFAVAPTVLWGIGELTLTSPAFRDLVLIPQAGPDGFFDVPNRWSNFAVLLGGDTLDSWRVDDTTIVAWEEGGWLQGTWPDRGRATGAYPVRVVADGAPLAEQDVTLVGLRDTEYPDWPFEEPPTPYAWGLPLQWGAGAIVALAQDDVGRVGTAVVDLKNRTMRMLGDWRAARNSPRLEGVGASYAPDRVVLDSSAAGDGAASYRVGTALGDERRLRCVPSGYASYYMAAEVAPATCLAWIALGSDRGFWANGQSVLEPTPGFQYTGTLPVFRIAPGTGRTIAEFASCSSRLRGGWPVFDDTPAVAYRMPEVGCVSGAQFSSDGDTLFLVASDTAQEYGDVAWSIQVRRAADGLLLRSMPMADAAGPYALRALLLDPVRPWLYVTGEPEEYGYDMLRVVHRESLEMIATVPGIGWGEPHSLIFGGSSGAVYVYSVREGHWVYIRAVDTPARYPP